MMRIILADNHLDVLAALRTVLQEEPEFCIVGEAVDAPTLFALAAVGNADLILLDRSLPGAAFPDQIAKLHGLIPRPIVIVMSSDPTVGRMALRVGADTFVSKRDEPEWLLNALHIHAARIKNRQELDGSL